MKINWHCKSELKQGREYSVTYSCEYSFGLYKDPIVLTDIRVTIINRLFNHAQLLLKTSFVPTWNKINQQLKLNTIIITFYTEIKIINIVIIWTMLYLKFCQQYWHSSIILTVILILKVMGLFSGKRKDIVWTWQTYIVLEVSLAN